MAKIKNRSGGYRTPVVIQRESTTDRLDSGERDPTKFEQVLPPTFANLESVAGREYFTNQQVHSEATHVARIRSYADARDNVKPDAFLLDSSTGQRYEVVAVSDIDARKVEMLIWLKEHLT